MIDPITAISLGVKPMVAPIGGAAASSVNATAGTVGGTFAEALAKAGENTVGKLTEAEKTSMEALRGNAGPRDVADAVMSAELALQSAIAIRDKAVSSYLEISRMAI